MRDTNWLKGFQLGPDAGADGRALRVRFPGPDTAFRVHPDEEWTGCLLYHERAWWLVHPGIQHCVGRAHKATLHLCVQENGELLLLPNTHPSRGYPTNWYDSWLAAVAEGRRRWITVAKNAEEDRYEHYRVKQPREREPEWPDEGIEAFVAATFAHRRIGSLDHPAVKAKRQARPHRHVEEEW